MKKHERFKKVFVILYCKSCERHYRLRDEVHLDEWNTIIHQTCYDISLDGTIKDSGTYEEIIYKYDFFKELR